MPRKYIKIRHVHARLPFRQCVIQFVVRRQERDPLLVSEIEFYAQAVSATLDENIELVYSQRHLTTLALYLVAINPENRVASIGFVPLRLAESCADRKEKMQGVEQNGFIVYSMQDEPFPRMSHLVNLKMSSSGNSAHSSEDAERNGLAKLDVKRSEFEPEEAEEKAENLKESKTERYRLQEGEKTLIRSNKDGLLPSLAVEDPQPMDSRKLARSLELNPRSPPELIAKSDLAEQMGLQGESAPSPAPSPSLASCSNSSHLTSQHEQLQSFIIDLLRHKLRNSEHFLCIQRSAAFLEQQRLRFAQLAQRPAAL